MAFHLWQQSAQGLNQNIHVGARVIALNRNPHEMPAIPVDDRNLDLELVVQAALQYIEVARRQGQGRQLREPLRVIGRQRRQTRQRADPLTRIAHQLVTFFAHSRPLLIALKLDGRRHGKVRGNVARALPFLLVDEL